MEFNSSDLHRKIINNYDSYMHLNIYIESNDNYPNKNLDLITKYNEVAEIHNKKLYEKTDYIDAGFDLYAPNDLTFTKLQVNKLDYGIVCEAKIINNTYDNILKSYNTGFYMYPRSSISKSNLRLANNVGIIDSGYRGRLIGMFDLQYDDTTQINKFDRYLQIVAPNMMPIIVEINIVDSFNELAVKTERGVGGFGSTGK